ncbi:MAG: hypothetical protein QXY62_02425 [Candidatus Altiarchaeota archaeon]
MKSTKIITNLILFLVILSFVGADIGKIYVVNLKYERGVISLVNDVHVKSGYPPGRKIQPDLGYRCEVISFEGKELYSFKFNLPTKWFYDYLDKETGELSGGVIELEKVNFTLIVPYFSNGKKINIYNQTGALIISIDISNFSLEKCGDGICDKNENYQNCPHDCITPMKEIEKYLTILGLGFFIILVFLIILKLKR